MQIVSKGFTAERFGPRIKGSASPGQFGCVCLGHAGKPHITNHMGHVALLKGTSRFYRARFPPRCLVWLGMLVWLVCVFFSQKGSKETPWQAAMRKLQHEMRHEHEP